MMARLAVRACVLAIAAPASAQLKIAGDSATAAANAVVDRLDAGSGPGTLVIFGSVCPDDADDADSGTTLAVLTFGDPAFGNAAAGIATANAITADSSANATGTARCFRAKDSDGNVVFQGTITTAGNGGDIILSSTSVTSGQSVSITSLTYEQPEEPTVIAAADLLLETVQAAVDAVPAGGTVLLPAGSETWTGTLTIDKSITLQGAGAGGILGRSSDSESVGTGTKTFTTQTGLAFETGETITARYTNLLGAHSMTGTVTSYSGDTLVLNVTSVTGSGTRIAWIFERPATTTIVNDYGSAEGHGLVLIEEQTAGSVEIAGIRFEDADSSVLGWHIKIAGNSGGVPVLIHNNWFSMRNMVGAIFSSANRGVIYNNSFNGYYCSASFLGCSISVTGALGIKNLSETANWASPSTMGTADTDGTANMYIEDNIFVAFWQAMTGLDGHSRMVIRHNIFVDAALGSHGAETEDLGVRHYEVYDNTFDQTDVGGDPYNLNYWFLMRGGTGVITDNTFDNINSPSYWGDKPELTFQIQALNRALSSALSCWGANTGATIEYPAPRQIGFGYVTGLGGNDPLGIYRGDLEPVYIWNNTGSPAISVQDYPGTDCTNPDLIADYFQSGRDYYLNAGAKPSYTKFEYPHPLR
jgi:hypothetical protein